LQKQSGGFDLYFVRVNKLDMDMPYPDELYYRKPRSETNYTTSQTSCLVVGQALKGSEKIWLKEEAVRVKSVNCGKFEVAF
jgi:hypothetical protein